MVNISEESVEIFTWKRHGNRDSLALEVAAAEKMAQALLKNWVLGSTGFLKDKIILDAGCGGGNKTVALSKICGAKQVVGLEFFLSLILRIHQFLFAGDTRSFLCVKTSRSNARINS